MSIWNCNDCISLVGHVGNGGGCACVQTGDIKGVSVPHAEFFCEPKTALKKSIFKSVYKELQSVLDTKEAIMLTIAIIY